jgi:membrane associated rhomboid family serine protease
MRSDAESIVIVVWVVLAITLFVAALYDAIGSGDWLIHLAVLAAGELLVALVARLALRRVTRRR